MRHRIPGVDGQVEHGVLQLVRVAKGRGKRLGQHQVELDPIAERTRQQRFHRGDHRIDVDGLQIEGVRPREGEQPMRQGGGAVERRQCRVERVGELFRPPLVDAPLHDVEGAHDALQQVVEIVGEAARHLAHGGHLVRLPERFRDLRGDARSLQDLDLRRRHQLALDAGRRARRMRNRLVAPLTSHLDLPSAKTKICRKPLAEFSRPGLRLAFSIQAGEFLIREL